MRLSYVTEDAIQALLKCLARLTIINYQEESGKQQFSTCTWHLQRKWRYQVFSEPGFNRYISWISSY